MNEHWILDVLTDLRTFAEQNGMPFLAGRLEDTHRLAAIELSGRIARRYVDLDAEAGEVARRRIAAGFERADGGGLDS